MYQLKPDDLLKLQQIIKLEEQKVQSPEMEKLKKSIKSAKDELDLLTTQIDQIQTKLNADIPELQTEEDQ